jgi:hypothetical protein
MSVLDNHQDRFLPDQADGGWKELVGWGDTHTCNLWFPTFFGRDWQSFQLGAGIGAPRGWAVIPVGDVPGGGGDFDRLPHDDEEACEQFYRRYFGSASKYLAAVSGGHGFVEDAVQEAMVVLWNKWELLGSDDHRKGYLFVTAKRRF